MNEEQFDQTMRDWAAREERAAPELRPDEAARRRLRELGATGSARPFPRLYLRWAAAAAGLVGALLILRAVLAPDALVPSHVRIAPWSIERAASFEGATLAPPGRGGPKAAPRAFTQLVFQFHRRGSDTVRGIDLLADERDPIVLAPGDHYRLGLRPLAELHVYVFQRFPVGEETGITALWPIESPLPAGNPLAGNTPRWIPTEPEWISLVDPRGEEALHIVASTRPVPELAELAARSFGTGTASELSEYAATLRGLLESLPRDFPREVQVFSFAFRSEP